MKARLNATVGLLLVSASLVVVGCGSNGSTSMEEAKAVAIAESQFRDEWRHAIEFGRATCAGKPGPSGKDCLERIEEPLRRHAIKLFSKEIDGILQVGVGPKCAEALKEARVTIPSVPSFPGALTLTCQEESRQ